MTKWQNKFGGGPEGGGCFCCYVTGLQSKNESIWALIVRWEVAISQWNKAFRWLSSADLIIQVITVRMLLTCKWIADHMWTHFIHDWFVYLIRIKLWYFIMYKEAWIVQKTIDPSTCWLSVVGFYASGILICEKNGFSKTCSDLTGFVSSIECVHVWRPLYYPPTGVSFA